MKRIYQAENVVDAHLVKGVLEQHGIVAFVTGEYLVGAIGELPVTGVVAVLVADEHEAEATRLAAELSNGRVELQDDERPSADGDPRPA